MDFSREGSPSIGAVIPGKKEVTCMSYHEDGKRLYAATEGDSRLQVIDCLNGKADQPALRCDRDQIHLVEATHHENAVLFAGKGSPTQPVGQRNAVSYWSVYDNKILRKFRGHADKVTSVSMCPADDTFLSSSQDRTVRLWTVQSAGCLAEMKLPDKTAGNPISVFDSTGLVFAVTAAMSSESEGAGQYVHLYDARNYSGGAFTELKVSQKDLATAFQSHISTTPDRSAELAKAEWKSMRFNVSGSQILVGADKGLSIVLDGFEGTVQRVLAPSSTTERPAVCCFTPDDKTILSGNEDGSITCWNVETGTVLKKLEGHPGPVNCVAVNPKYAQIASSCTQTALWIW